MAPGLDIDNQVEPAPKKVSIEEVVAKVPDLQTSEACNIRRHHIYYIETIVIRVEDTLFQVPQADLSHILGPRFKNSNESEQYSGDSYSHLSEITAQQFYAFMLALYPIDRNPSGYDEWLDVLHLSTKWGFKEIRERAIIQLSSLIKNRNPVETIITGTKYQVREWLLEAFQNLVCRERLTAEELRRPFQLDWETIAKVLSVRGQISPSPRISPKGHFNERPYSSCKGCKSRKKVYTCSYSCKALNLPLDCNGPDEPTEDSLWLGEEPDVGSRLSNVQAIVENEFLREIAAML